MIEIKPTDLDFSPLHERMQWYIDENIIPFCTSLVMQGTDIVDVAYLGGGTEESIVEPDSIFRMHSSTKIATSVLAMMLFEEGRFALDDPIETYLPELAERDVLAPEASSVNAVEPAHDSIRISQLLSHSAGLSYGFIEPDSTIDKAYNAADLNPLAIRSMTLESLCQRLGELPLAYQPGTSWRYSFATDVIARLVEVLSGQRFDQFMAERLLEPLSMIDTDFWVPEDKRDRYTTMFDPADPLKPMEPGLTPLPHEPITEGPPSFLSGGGGLMSTLVDYLRFIQMLVDGGQRDGQRFLLPETLELMRTNQLAPGVGVRFPMWHMPDTVFGLGFALKEAPADGEPESATGEYHWGGMAGTHFWMAPRAGITGVCMTQRMPGFWHPFSRDFKRLAYTIAS